MLQSLKIIVIQSRKRKWSHICPESSLWKRPVKRIKEHMDSVTMNLSKTEYPTILKETEDHIYWLVTLRVGALWVASTRGLPSFPECTNVTGLTSFAEDCTARANGLSLFDKFECTNVTLLSFAAEEWTTNATGLGSLPVLVCTAMRGLDWSEEFCTASVSGRVSLFPVVWATRSCLVSPGITLSPGPRCWRVGTIVARPWLVLSIGRCNWWGCCCITLGELVITFSWKKQTGSKIKYQPNVPSSKNLW